MTLVNLYRNHKWFDLILVNCAATIAILFVLSGIDSVLLRSVVGLPLILVIPGYLLITLFFGSSNSLQVIEYPLYICGLSIATVVVMGLALAMSPWGIKPSSFVISLGVFTYITSGLIYVGRRTQSTSPSANFRTRFRLNKSQYLLLIYAVIIMVGAFIVSYIGANQARQTNFTEFWMVPSNETSGRNIIIGIHNVEHSDVTYHIELTSGDKVVQEWKSILLKSGEEWSHKVTIDADMGSLEAVLYREDNPQSVYRRVTLQSP